jgi:hypothetical protein
MSGRSQKRRDALNKQVSSILNEKPEPVGRRERARWRRRGGYGQFSDNTGHPERSDRKRGGT